MSSYLKFYQLEKSPFDTSAQSKLVLGTKALRAAFAQIEQGLAEGTARICVSGAAGMGKTSLARALPKLLGAESRVALLLNPALPWDTLRAALIRQLGLQGGIISRKNLMEAAREQRLVIVLDQAEKLDRETLEHLDILLSYRSDGDEQLLTCILLANLAAAAEMDDCPLLWWLDKINTLQLEFAPIPVSGVHTYIRKHLKRAGWKGGELFTPDAAAAVHHHTGGVPREISRLCEEVLAVAGEREVMQIEPELVEELGARALPDSERFAPDLPSTPSPQNLKGDPAARPSAPPEPEPEAAPSAAARAPVADAGRRIESAPTTTAAPPRQVAVDSPLSLDAFFGGADLQAAEPPVQDEGVEGPAAAPLEEPRRGLGHRLMLAAAILIVCGGGAAAYTLGLIPGLDEMGTVAQAPPPPRPERKIVHFGEEARARAQAASRALARERAADTTVSGTSRPAGPSPDQASSPSRASTPPSRSDTDLRTAPPAGRITAGRMHREARAEASTLGAKRDAASRDTAAETRDVSRKSSPPASPAPVGQPTPGRWEDPAEAPVDERFW